jgi:hypothetical protein
MLTCLQEKLYLHTGAAPPLCGKSLMPADESSANMFNKESAFTDIQLALVYASFQTTVHAVGVRLSHQSNARHHNEAETLQKPRQSLSPTSHHATVLLMLIRGRPAILSFLRLSSVPTLNCRGSTYIKPGPLPSKSLAIHLPSYHSNLYSVRY